MPAVIGYRLARKNGAKQQKSLGSNLRNETNPALLYQIVLEDRHLELERAIVILVIDEQHADEFLADIDFSGIVLFRSRHHADLRITESAFEICVELPDFLNVHSGLPCDYDLERSSESWLALTRSNPLKPQFHALARPDLHFARNA